MRFSGSRYCSPVRVVGLAIGFALLASAGVTAGANNKVIIYPTSQDSIDQLKQEGVTDVRDYGSYWVVEATDDQVKALEKRHGERAVQANYLNRIELRSVTLDTTAAQPVVPSKLRQATQSGKHLRLIQFKGPVQPEWLDQVKAAGKIRIVSYIPNSAYVVSLDQQTEGKLDELTGPSGSIQWIGDYDPSYKMNPLLLNVQESEIEVQIGVVDSPEAGQTLQVISGYALQQMGKPTTLANQIVVRIKVHPTDLASVAQLPDVLWIERSAPLEMKDEVQDLIMANRVSGLPGNGPVPGFDDYLDFLTNVVGFSTDPAEYPVLDDADTLATATTFFNDFFEFGNPTNATRLAGFLSLCPVSAVLCENFHGPFVMSVASAYNDSKNDPANLDANGFRKGLGVSPFGRISNTIIFNVSGSDCVFCVPNSDHPSLADIPLNEYQVFGARISNNSWGSVPVAGTGGDLGIYNGDSQSFDVTVRDALESGRSTNGSASAPFPLNQEMITIFAAGNAQGLGAGNGGFGDIIVTPPATAKNVISVGASENVRNATEATTECVQFASEADNSFDISVFSSFGPTLDLRFKPEIVAPGAAIFGVDGLAAPFFKLVGSNLVEVTSNAYTCASGTSFAAPAVAASAQLLWWYFQHRLQNEQGRFYLQPSPAMVKAYLCNSARYLPISDPQTGARDTLPSPSQGMGILDLARMFDGVPRIVRDETTPRAIDTPLITTNPIPQQTFFSRSGQSYEVSGRVADPTNPFRVTLAWTDAPGNPGALKQLVNDLDLQVTIGGQIYKGNNFVGPDSVPVSVAKSSDQINNMESVFLPPGQTGTWSVIVRAANIAGNGVPNVGNGLGQDFALVIYNAATTNRSDVPNLTTNDTCQTAMAVTSFPFTFSNLLTSSVYANVQPSPSAGRGGIDEFFKIPLPTPGAVFTINTAGSAFSTVLSVWKVQVIPQSVFVSGDCGALIEVASNIGGASPSSLTFTADGSNDYFIVVEPQGGGAGGLMQLNISALLSSIVVSPTALVFPDQMVGLTSAVQTVTFQNNSPVDVFITFDVIGGTNASDFIIQSDTCQGSSIPAGGSCAVQVAFVPTANGARNAVLEISDDATGSPRLVPLSGNGLAPEPAVCINNPGTVTFPATVVFSNSAAQSVIITNCGTAPLAISSNPTISGTDASDFSISSDSCSGTSVGTGGNCTINVVFTPSANGLRSASLTINTTNRPTVITLQGTGTVAAPAICAIPSSIAFGSQPVNTTSAAPTSVTISNCGTAALIISNVTLVGANAGEFLKSSDTCSGNSLAIGATCTFGVSFAPTNLALKSASVIISNNSTVNPLTISLTGAGSGFQPDLAINSNLNLKKFKGLGVFSTPNNVGTNETLVQKGSRGAKKVFYVLFKNAGNAADAFQLRPNEKGLIATNNTVVTTNATVRYFLGANPKDSSDVTAMMEAGSLTTGTLAPGAVTDDTTLLRVEITASKNTKTIKIPSGTNTVVITGSSAHDSTKSDSVAAVVPVK